MFERGPMTMRLISPRSTAPYQTLDSSSRITSPITVAPGTTHALEWMVGPFLKRAAIPACPVGSVSGVTCMLAINLQRPNAQRPMGESLDDIRQTNSNLASDEHCKNVIKRLASLGT